MLKAVFRPTELVALPDKVKIDSPTSYMELSHFAPKEDLVEDLGEVEEYSGPTADDLRREAEMFKNHWDEEKQRMIDCAKEEAENIVQEAQRAAFAEVKRQTDESLIIKQQAEEEAEKIISDARAKASEIELEVRQTVDAERKAAQEEGRELGKKEGFSEGKAEVDRLIERTQVVLERAQDKRAEILNETEKQIIDLVLLIARKVIKVISENQRNIIIANVVEALRKIKSRGDVILRVNLADLKLATEHKEDFINLMERAKSLQIIEDSTVDSGGCIVETDFGEVDARIASQLAELENKILEISPIKSIISDNIPIPVVRTGKLKAEMAAQSLLPQRSEENYSRKDDSETDDDSDEDDAEVSQAANAALTASAALAALATMATKGKREIDKKITKGMDNFGKRKTD